MSKKRKTEGFSLVELGIVVAILALVAAIATRRLGNVRGEARRAAAEAEMETLRRAFAGDGVSPGFLDDMSSVPGFTPGFLRMADILTPTNLFLFGGERVGAGAADGLHRAPAAAFLSWDPLSGRGWRGPYVLKGAGGNPATGVFPSPALSRGPGEPTFGERGFHPDVRLLSLPREVRERSGAYGFAGEPAVFDPWGAPYCLQIPPPQAFQVGGGVLADVSGEERFRYARIVSAGPDGVLQTPCYFGNTNAAASSWTAAQRRASIFGGRPEDRGDDLVLFLTRSDVDEQ